jgi:hypothetical protein
MQNSVASALCYQNLYITSPTNEGIPSHHYQYCASTASWAVNDGTNITVTNTAWDSGYHPTPGSPLINAGDPNGQMDADGSRPDIGCYGGPNPFNDNGVALWYPFLANVWINTPIVGPGESIQVEATGEIGSAP